MKKKHIIAAILATIGFLGLGVSGWNPYTGFLFVLTMFFAGTCLPGSPKKSVERFQQVVSTLQVLSIVGAMCTAACLLGQETFFRIIRNPVFLFLCWLWVQLVIIERFYSQTGTGKGQNAPADTDTPHS